MAGSSDSESTTSELYDLSFDTIEDDIDHPPWYSIIQNLSYDQLDNLKTVFKHSTMDESLTKEEFRNIIDSLYDSPKYSFQSMMLFEEIAKERNKITWNDFIDFLMGNLYKENEQSVAVNSCHILPVPHTKKETIVKIVLIDNDKYFCYAMISKYGRVGVYDGNLDFLTTYHLIMTREDISRKEEERRRRNRWVTDAIFWPDLLMLAITSSVRSIAIYEASGLKHVPLWLILSTPNIIECFAYKGSQRESMLFMGDNRGQVSSFQFLQPKIGPLRRKSSDKISLFYWDELCNEKNFLIYKSYGHFHKNNVLRLQYFEDNDTLISCSKDPAASVIIKYVRNKAQAYTFKMNRGTTCFALSRTSKVLVTGSSDGVLRIWNPVITQKPTAVVTDHLAEIVDVAIMDNQDTFFSCSSDGVLKQWHIKEHKCLNSIKIKFPAFNIHGKLIEWGFSSIHPGPKRVSNVADEDSDSLKRRLLDTWERSHLLISCCNYLAAIKLTFGDPEVEKSFELPILPPPPLQNSVLIPKFWKISDSNPLEVTPEQSATAHVALERLNFILEGNWLDEEPRDDINYKIATLERKKLHMQKYVAKGAPYLALDLHEIEELKLSPDLPVPNKKKIKNIVDGIEKIIQGAVAKDAIFSESSSSKSPRSSRSSIVEFPL